MGITLGAMGYQILINACLLMWGKKNLKLSTLILPAVVSELYNSTLIQNPDIGLIKDWAKA